MNAKAGFAALFFASALTVGAHAEDRSAQPLSIVLGSGLTQPWLMQFRQSGSRHGAGDFPRERTLAFHQVKREPQGHARPPIDPIYLPRIVAYATRHEPGTIVIDTSRRFLFLVLADGTALRYGVGVGKPGFEWAGAHRITRKARWPDWRPPVEMIARERLEGRHLPKFVAGGPDSPLGARALYLGSTLYRIHGTNQPWTIGGAVSSGCIRMRNDDVIDLYGRVGLGTKVIVI